MNTSKLKRNPTKAHAALKKVKDGSVVAVRSCEIHIPTRYIELGLASIGNQVEFLCVYAIVVGDSYGVSTTDATIRSSPSDTRTEQIEGVEYTVFMYEPGDAVFTTSEVIRVDTLIYDIWNEFVDKGKTPWFMERDDINNLVFTARSHADANLYDNHAIIEMINSVRVRNSKERTEHIRYALNAGRKPEEIVIGLRNLMLTADTTSAKIGGSYAEIGISSAILQPSDQAEGLEKLLLS